MKKIIKLILTTALVLSSLLSTSVVFAEQPISIGEKTIYQGVHKVIYEAPDFEHNVSDLSIIKNGESEPLTTNLPFNINLFNEESGFSVDVDKDATAGKYNYSFKYGDNTYSGSITVVESSSINSVSINKGAYKKLLPDSNSEYQVSNTHVYYGTNEVQGVINIGCWSFENNTVYAAVANVDDNASTGTYTYLFVCNDISYKGTVVVNEPTSNNILGTSSNPINVFMSDEYVFAGSYNIDYGTISIKNSNDVETYSPQEGNNKINLSANNDGTISIFAQSTAEAGKYCISYKDDQKNTYTGYINIVSPYVTYNGQKVIVGLGNNSQGGSLHVSSIGGSQVDQKDTGFGMTVGAAYVDENGNSLGATEQDFADLIKSVTFTYENTKISITAAQEGTTVKDKDNNDVTFKAYSGNYIGTIGSTPDNQAIIGKIDIDLDENGTADTTVYCKYRVTTVTLKSFSINIYDNTNAVVSGISGNTAIDKINYILNSKDNLGAVLKALNGNTAVDIESESYINQLFIYLDNKEYSGEIISNIDSKTNVQVFIFSKNDSYTYGVGYDAKEIKEYKETDNSASPAANTRTRTILKGGIINNGAIYGVRGIDFVATSNTKIGILANGVYDEMAEPIADFAYIFECSFTGYEYGIKAEGNVLVSGVQYCKFENNKIGLYIDSIKNGYGSDTLYNTFINNDVAIDIESLPSYTVPYEFVLRENYFYNTKTNYVDYKLSDNDSLRGTFFFTGCYFAKDYTAANRYLNSNVRGSEIVVNKNNTKAIISPCIKYPESVGSGPILGFDIGGSGVNALVNGSSYSMSVSGLTKNTNLEIDICTKDGEENGKIIIGGNN